MSADAQKAPAPSAETERAVEVAKGLSEGEIDCLKHTLGLNQIPPQDRNYFAASPGSEDDVWLTALSGLGVVERYARPKDNPHMPYNVYRALPFGRLVARSLAGEG